LCRDFLIFHVAGIRRQMLRGEVRIATDHPLGLASTIMHDGTEAE